MIKLNRGRIILLSLAVSGLILAVPAVLSRRVRLAAADLFEPITSTAHSLLGGVRARIRAFGRGTQLQQELETERSKRLELETRLAEKAEELARYKRTHEEVKELRRVLDDARYRGEALAANVIRRPGKWQSHELIVDRGTASGVQARLPVLAGEAVLGVVEGATENTARVLTLGHPKVAVPARIVETRQQGLVETSGGRLKLRFVIRDPSRPVQRNHTVVTSGLGGIFPPGCLIGTVAAGVAPAEGKPFYDITVDPPRTRSNPEVVWVLTRPAPASGTKRSGE